MKRIFLISQFGGAAKNLNDPVFAVVYLAITAVALLFSFKASITIGIIVAMTLIFPVFILLAYVTWKYFRKSYADFMKVNQP